jgi:hypothetical protein
MASGFAAPLGSLNVFGKIVTFASCGLVGSRWTEGIKKFQFVLDFHHAFLGMNGLFLFARSGSSF